MDLDNCTKILCTIFLLFCMLEVIFNFESSRVELTSIFSSPNFSTAFSSERPQAPYSKGVNTVVGTFS